MDQDWTLYNLIIELILLEFSFPYFFIWIITIVPSSNIL